MTTREGYRFNRDYNDLEQVREYMPAFVAVLAEIEAAGQYRYNNSFRGRVAGIEGPDEDTAIYLLQGLEHQDRQDEKVAAMLAIGYEWVDSMPATVPLRFAHICLVPRARNGGEWAEYRDARLVSCARAWPNGAGLRTPNLPSVVLPKGCRTNGYLVSGRRVLALYAESGEQNATCAGCGKPIKRYGSDGIWFTDKYDCTNGGLHHV